MTAGLGVEAHLTVFRDPAFYCGPGPAAIHDPEADRRIVAFRRVPRGIAACLLRER